VVSGGCARVEERGASVERGSVIVVER